MYFFLFIGISKLRKNSSTFGKLDFAKNANQAGIVIVHLPTKSITGKINYLNSLDEIYDIHILKDKKRPNILNTLTDDHKNGLSLPKSFSVVSIFLPSDRLLIFSIESLLKL